MATQKKMGNNVLKALAAAQKLFEKGQILPTNMAPKNPVINAALDLATYLPNTVYGQGIVGPTADMTRNVRNTIQGEPLVPYNDLASPLSKLGYQAGNALNNQTMPDIPMNGSETTQNALGGINPIITALTLQALLKSVGGNVGALQNAYKQAGQRLPIKQQLPPDWQHTSLGQLQEMHQVQSGVAPLAQLDQAMRAGNYRGVIEAAGKILQAPKSSPLAPYQNSLKQYTEPAYKNLVQTTHGG